MEKIVVRGGNPLFGNVEVSGMKNAALPIIFATILVNDVCVLENLPDVSDIKTALEILRANGEDAYVIGEIIKGNDGVVFC